MEIRNLVTFLKVTELNSFSKAAEALDYSQSAVTVQIQQLERELGVRLLTASGRTSPSRSTARTSSLMPAISSAPSPARRSLPPRKRS